MVAAKKEEEGSTKIEKNRELDFGGFFGEINDQWPCTRVWEEGEGEKGGLGLTSGSDNIFGHDFRWAQGWLAIASMGERRDKVDRLYGMEAMRGVRDPFIEEI